MASLGLQQHDSPATLTDPPLTTPTVSVVLPTYNRADTIGAAIRSVLCQSFAALELIVVDDGSTDNTSEVVDALDDPHSRYHVQANRGASAARNAGIAEVA
ncbi:hypothetical protein CKO31_14255 [Thiohalocapsa halophila]|uniref:Glycosyltransferase 2-like domain-containing protein n=1 Tax=Thiohalocapsa halophila TaxID=69359 RepID=A0ABS1CIY9_9GAMM|nr:glycosyltransferase [Thiohalocapsa halophila]MBK1631876.1 hypothetical protein [Thiohalocapsa halophila]